MCEWGTICCYISHTFDLFLSAPAYLHLLSTLTCSTLPRPVPPPPHPTPPSLAPGMASILMSAVGLGVHFTSAPLPQQQQQQQQLQQLHQQQQPAPFSLPPPLLPPASRPSKPPTSTSSSSSSSSVRRAKRQHRRGSYHATGPSSTCLSITGLRSISSCISSPSPVLMCSDGSHTAEERAAERRVTLESDRLFCCYLLHFHSTACRQYRLLSPPWRLHPPPFICQYSATPHSLRSFRFSPAIFCSL